MTYKFNVPINELTGIPRVRAERALSIWGKLLAHSMIGKCNCHLDSNGEVHIIEGCVTGRHLYEEYQLAVNLLKNENKENKL